MAVMIGVLILLSIIPVLAWLGNGLSGTRVYDIDNAQLIRVLKKQKEERK